MASTHFITGNCKWAKVFKPDTKFDDNGIYSIQVYLDAEGKQALKDAKLRLQVKTDDDGEYVTLRRKKVVDFGKGPQDIGPPEVVDDKNQPFTDLVGNGSNVTVKFESYPAGPFVGHRIMKVRVNELVRYEKPDNTGIEEPEVEEPKTAVKTKSKGMPF